jgi:two-component system, OmpR family, sensor histidine kinase KdpD
MGGQAESDWRSSLTRFAFAGISIFAVTLLLAPFRNSVGILNVGLIFLLLTLLISGSFGRRVGVLAAITTNFLLNFMFVEPHGSFSLDEWPEVLSLIVFLGVSIVGGTLLASSRAAAAEARQRQEETEVLLRLSRTLNAQTDPQAALSALCKEVVRAFDAPGASLIRQREGAWAVLASAGSEEAGRLPDREERALAQEALASGQLVFVGDGPRPGRPTRIVSARGIERQQRATAFVPLRVGEDTFGVLRLDGPVAPHHVTGDGVRLLEPFATEAALAMHRLELAQATVHFDALRQADELKTALLTSISHDLKTPLAGIKASVTSLLDTSVDWSEEDRQAFLEAIESQSDRLDRVISDILNLNRIEQGAVAPFMETVRAGELLEEARERTGAITRERRVTVEADPDLEVEVDESLIVQALVNLIENAAKYSADGKGIHLRAARIADGVELSVEDEGPGIPEEELPHVFERFYRGANRGLRTNGLGLGLAVVRGFAHVCRGEAYVENAARGCRFVIQLPAATRSAVHS